MIGLTACCGGLTGFSGTVTAISHQRGDFQGPPFGHPTNTGLDIGRG